MSQILFSLPDATDTFSLKGELLPIDQISRKSGFIIQDVSQQLYFLEGEKENNVAFNFSTPDNFLNHNADTSRKDYEEIIFETVTAIQKGEFEKAVMSKREFLDGNYELERLWQNIQANYTNTFKVLLESNKLGNWIGASPEVLLQYKSNHFTTYSLAGTVKHPDLFTDKEKEEQQIVTDYIIGGLESLKVESLKVSEQKPVQAGNIWHLKTTITFEANPSDLHRILNTLHPTPAVIGTPLDKAFEWVLSKEKSPRKLYTGFWGYIEPEEGYIFVNLRCGELYQNGLLYYVGGGITKDSVPQKEWEETLNKTALFRQCFENSQLGA